MKKNTDSAPRRRAFDKAAKIKALVALEKNDFQLHKTALSLNIHDSMLKRWRIELGSEVFDKQPRTDIVQKTVNAVALREVSKTNLQTVKQDLATTAAKIIMDRLKEKDKDKLSKIEMRDLIQIVKLYEEPNSTPENDLSVFNNIMDKYREFRQKKKDQVDEAEIVE